MGEYTHEWIQNGRNIFCCDCFQMYVVNARMEISLFLLCREKKSFQITSTGRQTWGRLLQD